MSSLFIFFVVGLSGILAFTIWGLTQLVKKRRMRKRRTVIRFHQTQPDGTVKITEKTVDYKDYFNFSQKEFEQAQKYVAEAIKNNEFKLGTTLEQQTDLAKTEREKDAKENSKS